MSSSARHIDNFPEMIFDHFREVIELCNLKVIDNTDQWVSEVRIVGPKCELEFSFDRGDLRCYIINPLTGERYFSNYVYELFRPKAKDLNMPWEDSPDVVLSKYARIFNEELFAVLKGDYSWTDEYARKFP